MIVIFSWFAKNMIVSHLAPNNEPVLKSGA